MTSVTQRINKPLHLKKKKKSNARNLTSHKNTIKNKNATTKNNAKNAAQRPSRLATDIVITLE